MTTKPMANAIEAYDYVFPYKKIKIPFRERREKVRWPGNKLVAVKFCVPAEWWGRIYQPKVYHASGGKEGEHIMDVSYLSEGQDYGLDIAVWRALDLFDRHDVKVTFMCSGGTARHRPDVIREIHAKGHEVAGHSFYQSRGASRMTEEEEREDIVRTTEALQHVTGVRPLGWDCTGIGAHERSFRMLAEHGYVWNGDLRDDDLPYGIVVGDDVLVEIPHRSRTTGDYSWFNHGLMGEMRSQRGAREAADFFCEAFDGYYETARREWPQLITVVIHPYTSCIPDRIHALDRIIAYMKGCPDVWFPTYIELAQYWKKTYLGGK
ncbi:MAG: polysaccharide deacetylase family protein [Burkholderiales bacterium]